MMKLVISLFVIISPLWMWGNIDRRPSLNARGNGGPEGRVIAFESVDGVPLLFYKSDAAVNWKILSASADFVDVDSNGRVVQLTDQRIFISSASGLLELKDGALLQVNQLEGPIDLFGNQHGALAVRFQDSRDLEIFTIKSGAAKWRREPLQISKDGGIVSAFFSEAGYVWFLGFRDVDERNRKFYVYRKDPRDDDWMHFEAPNFPGHHLQFLNAERGWMSSDTLDGVYETLDGGETWIEVSAPERYCQLIGFTSEINGFAFSSLTGSFYQTADGGTSWTAVDSDDILKMLEGQEPAIRNAVTFWNALQPSLDR